MQTSHALGAAADDSPAAGGHGQLRFPPFPGENPLQHEAHIWLEIAEARLASAGLLIVANGGVPAAARHIVDVPLDRLPPLPPDHRDYERRMETRIRIETENHKNAARRYDLTMAAWTSIYAALKECTARTAPLLSRELLDVCDLSLAGIAEGYFDGPRAWRMAVHRLAGEERSKHDKEYYRTAEQLQRSKPLPDGCSAAEYSKRALAYLTHIKPHLPYASSPLDSAEYLIDLLPRGTSLAPFRMYATFLYLSLLFTGAQAMDNPNQRTDYDELKGIQVWNGLPYHDFRLIWLAALTAVWWMVWFAPRPSEVAPRAPTRRREAMG